MKRLFFAVGFALAAAFEALALVMAAEGPLVPALALHLASAGLVAECLWWRSRGRALTPAWFWAGFFPVFGWATVVLLVLCFGKRGKPATGESWEARRRRAAAEARAAKSEGQNVPAAVSPLVDALRHPDPKIRAGAVAAVHGERSQRMVRLLARARDDESYDVRVRAVETLGFVSKQCLDEIGAATRALAQAPDSAAAHVTLARLYFEYADLGIDEPAVSRAYFERALDHAKRAWEAAPAFDAEVVLLAGRAWWRLGDLERAEAAHLRVLEREPALEEALVGLAELQFQRRDFAGLATTRARLLASGTADPALLASIERWSARRERSSWSRPSS